MPDLADTILLAACLKPGEWTTEALVETTGQAVAKIEEVITDLRERGQLQKRRGNPAWQGSDRIRSTKAGQRACRATLRAELLGESAGA